MTRHPERHFAERIGAIRVTFRGALAMAATAAVGTLFGATV